MFNMLNKRAQRGKKPPMVCKILDWLTELSGGLSGLFGLYRYVFEDRELRNRVFEEVGLRIAFLVRQPVLIRIRIGKG